MPFVQDLINLVVQQSMLELETSNAHILQLDVRKNFDNPVSEL